MIILLDRNESLNELLKAEIIVLKDKKIIQVNVDALTLDLLVDTYISNEK
jgi:hypothetical protein